MRFTTDAANSKYLLITNPLILKFRRYNTIQVTKQDEVFYEIFLIMHFKKNYSKKYEYFNLLVPYERKLFMDSFFIERRSFVIERAIIKIIF